ncbi:MAG TPA: hypothetical protein VGM05_12640 [Planctomycetaceae bacterium]|jgi:hypothetical protein
MKLDAQKYREILRDSGSVTPTFAAPDEKFREWLSQKRVPLPLVEFLIENAVRDEVPIDSGCGGMWTPEGIMENNDQKSAILASGLLAVGHSIIGDFIAIDLTEGIDEVGYVSHEELRGDPPADIRDIFDPVAASIHEMLAEMAAESDDYPAAQERRELRGGRLSSD